MATKVGKLYKNKIVRDLKGNIIDWVDEAHGGAIVLKGQIVNKDKWEELLQKEQDRKEAAKAHNQPRVDPSAPDRSSPPSKVEELEKRMDGMEGKLDAILDAVKGKK